MRAVVVGATGNTGASLLGELAREPSVDSVLGVAQRLPELDVPKAEWAAADVEGDERSAPGRCLSLRALRGR